MSMLEGDLGRGDVMCEEIFLQKIGFFESDQQQ